MVDGRTALEVERAIACLADEYARVPGLILTEDDLKCQLFRRLAHLHGLDSAVTSADEGILASPIHTEVPWFDETNSLRLRPDITITDPRRLSVQRALQDGLPLPRKGFHFVGDSIIIELKFYRGQGGIVPRHLQSIRRDVEKLRRLIQRSRSLSPTTYMFGIVAVFAKSSRRCAALDDLAREVRSDDRVRLIIPSSCDIKR